MSAFSVGLMPGWLLRASAAVKKAKSKTLVVLFQRGAADGLNMVPPFLDPNYRQWRPSIKVGAPTKGSAAIDLDGRFGLHPALSRLLPLWKEKRFAIVHAVGSHDPGRSHEQAQDFMESGMSGRSLGDGWLNRALKSGKAGKTGPLDGLALVRPCRLPKVLSGSYPVASMSSLVQPPIPGMFAALYDETTDTLLGGPVHEIVEARKIIDKLPRPPQKLYRVNKSLLTRDLDELAWLIKADVGLRVAFIDMPPDDWDHHYNEAARLERSLTVLGDTISSFYRDLGDRGEDVLLMTMTEFGRTLRENIAGGTDHGHASVMLLFGRKIKGGRVYGRWPGLETENLFEGRDLQVTTDYRQVLSEVLTKHLQIRDIDSVFPGGPFPPLGLI